MRTTLQRYLDAARARRAEGKDEGFSLIELIVVVAILGILVAIAIPVFGNIQETAQTNALKAIAATGATQAAADFANNVDAAAVQTNVAKLSDTKEGIKVELTKGTGLTDICVTATKNGKSQTSGPGC